MLQLQVGDTIKYLETVSYCDGKVSHRGSYSQVTEENLSRMNHFNNKSVIKVQGIPDHG